MKKILTAIAFVFATLGFVNAQTTPQVTKETKKQKKEKVTQTQTTTTSNGLKKDGTPDMRLKANRTKVQTSTPATVTPQATTTLPSPTVQTRVTTQKKTRTQVQAQPQVQPQIQQQRTQVSTTTTKSADPVVETDAKGRTIYQGPRGGKYYINKNGHKEYIK